MRVWVPERESSPAGIDGGVGGSTGIWLTPLIAAIREDVNITVIPAVALRAPWRVASWVAVIVIAPTALMVAVSLASYSFGDELSFGGGNSAIISNGAINSVVVNDGEPVGEGVVGGVAVSSCCCNEGVCRY